MSTTQNLKFIHLANTAAASEGSYDKGAIIFEPKSGRIAVKGNSGLEYYGGGRISDAKFENSILTISFNNGDKDIVLDFTDTASASGVDKILGKLRTDVNAIGGRVTTLEGKVATNTSDITANKEAIDLINHDTKGILAEAKKYTDGKVDGKFDAVGSADQALADAKAYADSLAKNYDAVGAAAQALADAKAYTNEKVGEINTAAEALGGRVTTLEGKVGDASNGLVKDVADLSKLHADKVGETGKKTVAQEIIDKVGSEITGTVKEYVDGKDTAVRKYVADEVSTINGVTGGLNTRIGALETTVGDSTKGLVKKVNTLVGTDADKSVRAISAEEVAKVVANAPENFDTLKEIADWIARDTTGSAQMANDIAALKNTVGNENSGLVKDVATNAGKIATNATNIGTNTDNITKLQGLHANKTDGTGKMSVADEVAAGIKGLGTVTKTNDEGNPKTADVVVTVTTKEGKVSAVDVDASGLRNDLGQKTAAASADTAFGRIKALETAVGDENSGLVKGVADNASAIKDLQDAQASGSLMWSVWD